MEGGLIEQNWKSVRLQPVCNFYSMMNFTPFTPILLHDKTSVAMKIESMDSTGSFMWIGKQQSVQYLFIEECIAAMILG